MTAEENGGSLPGARATDALSNINITKCTTLTVLGFSSAVFGCDTKYLASLLVPNEFQTLGKYNVGMKFMKADHGNDCTVFYPVDKTIKPELVTPYINMAKR